MVFNPTRRTHGLLTLLAERVNLKRGVGVAIEATSARTGGLEVVIHG